MKSHEKASIHPHSRGCHGVRVEKPSPWAHVNKYFGQFMDQALWDISLEAPQLNHSHALGSHMSLHGFRQNAKTTRTSR